MIHGVRYKRQGVVSGRLQSVLDCPMYESKAGVAENLTVGYDFYIAGLEKLTDGEPGTCPKYGF